VPVRGELDPVPEPAGEIGHEGVRRVPVPRSDVPRRDQLRLGVDRDPSPHVAGFLGRPLRLLDVLLLRVDELPDFVALQPPAVEVSVASWYSAQTRPRSRISLRIVGFETPVMRAVARMLLPSTRTAMTRQRRSVDSLLIHPIIPLPLKHKGAMKAFRWQGGLHIEPENAEEVEELVAFAKVLGGVRIEQQVDGPPISGVETGNEESVARV